MKGHSGFSLIEIVIAAAIVLILAGVQLVALGLLGEMQVRHYYEPAKRVPYSVDRVVRAEVRSSQEKD